MMNIIDVHGNPPYQNDGHGNGSDGCCGNGWGIDNGASTHDFTGYGTQLLNDGNRQLSGFGDEHLLSYVSNGCGDRDLRGNAQGYGCGQGNFFCHGEGDICG